VPLILCGDCNQGSFEGLTAPFGECPELLMMQDRVPPTLPSSGPLKFVELEKEDWKFSQN